MEYQLEWQIPKRVLFLKISGDISLEDLERLNTDMVRYLEQGTAPVHVISLGHNVGRVPTNLLRIKQIVNFVQDPKNGWTIIIQEKPNPLAGFIASVATQAAGMKMRHVKSLVDAIETLKRLDQSLGSDVAPV